MSSSRSSSSQNTRVFSPTVVLQGDSRRLEITLKTGEGYSLAAGITAGDCIRYNPGGNIYEKSSAATEATAEVVGVVEYTNGSSYTVVTSGSIQYPASRLAAITEGDVGGVDVLFLDYATYGGLTGTVEIPTGAAFAFVKPVLQIAPHGIYNAIVLNYIGYKIGNNAQLTEQGQPVGTVIQVPKDTDLGELYLDMSVSHLVSVSENPILYQMFGIANENHTVQLVMTSTANITSGLIGQSVTQRSSYGNGSIGTVTAINAATKTVTITRTVDTQTITTGYCYIKNITFNVASFSVTEFTIPQKNAETVGNTQYIYAINTSPISTVIVPDSITATDITTDTLAVGSIADLEAKITSMQNQINTLNTRVGIT